MVAAIQPIRRRGNELNGFQWSMWIKPETALDDGTTLMEMRSPAYVGTS